MRKINRLQENVLSTALHRVSSQHLEGINIYELPRSFKEKKPIAYGVNWSAQGTQTVDETRKFTGKLLKAAGIAELMTSLELRVDYSDKGYSEEDNLTEKDWEEMVSEVVVCIMTLHKPSLIEFLDRTNTKEDK